VSKALLVVIALLAAFTAAMGEGGVPGAFLNYAIAARSLGMGKAFTAIADDVQPGCSN
jgi:acetylornithine/succinyldiaminopimelate/putrescine aminotransferase